MKRLSKKSRFVVLFLGFLLVAVYFFPLWSIRLTAPQYPEGLGMNIWVHRITGMSEFDLTNINLLNHYIGMAPIQESSIPELQYMQYILAFMAAGAFAAAAFPRRFMIYLGLTNLVLVGAAGFYDFWRWGYEYGHNLSPDAPIKIPGMMYQPPLIGCKQILNITSCSSPHISGILLLVVGVVLAAILFFDKGDNR